MCWSCDRPGSTHADYLDYVRQLVDRHGWAIQAVERDGARPPYAYTVGLSAIDRPELLVTGLSMSRSGSLLNVVAGHLGHAEAPAVGSTFRTEIRGAPLVEVVGVAEPTVHLLTAIALFGASVRALQLVYADGRGRWPWEVGYRGGKGGQPVLGPRRLVAG